MTAHPELEPYGWDDDRAAALAEVLDGLPADDRLRPARVVRHDGVALIVAAPEGVVSAMLGKRLDPEPVVGDWVVIDRFDNPVAVLPRASLLRRREAKRDREHALAANLDVVLLVCGADRPIKPGRIHRAATLARDAGAEPVVVLTKAVLAEDVGALVTELVIADPTLDIVVTSVKEGQGLDELTERSRNRTVALLGESGAGKSSIVNALLADEVAATGSVRAGDAKGRHTTTTRELHLLPGGGALIDTPGIRAVGLFVDPDAVDETFADIDELAETCRFSDCGHDSEPGCAIRAGIEDGTVSADRVAAWQSLAAEASALALRADRSAQRKQGRVNEKILRDAYKRKPKDRH